MVEAAERLGVSKKRFEGWEPATVYEHDDDGRLVASRPETEWDAQQRGWMLALAEWRSSRCPCGCGNNVADTTGPEIPGQWRVRRVRCHARAAQVQAQRRASNNPEDLPEARLWWTEKVR